MARIRTIKPQHVNDKELSRISLQAHLFWVLSWCFADDEGIIENDPLLLKNTIFPRRTDIRVEQVEQWIDQLTKARFVIPFTYNGEGYLLHRTFKIHQKIDRPQPSKIPSEIIQRTFDEHSTNDRRCIVEDSKGKDSSVAAVESSPPLPTHSKEEIEFFNQVQEWLKKNASAVLKMKEPLTIDQFLKIRDRFPDKAFVSKILQAMHNWNDLLKKRKSAYLTFLTFAERETNGFDKSK